MKQKVVSLQEHKNEKTEMFLETSFESLIPLIHDEKEKLIPVIKSKIKDHRNRLKEILESEKITRTNFDALPKTKRLEYKNLKISILLNELAILDFRDFKFKK
jgi:hypothetical protein